MKQMWYKSNKRLNEYKRLQCLFELLLAWKENMKSGKWLMLVECWCHRMQNQWGLPCKHSSVHSTLPGPPRSSLSQVITILQEGHKRDSSTCVLFSLCPQEHKADSCFLEKMETCKQPGCMISILFNFSFSFPPRNKPDLCLNRFVTQKLCFLHSIKNQEHKFSVPRCFSSI